MYLFNLNFLINEFFLIEIFFKKLKKNTHHDLKSKFKIKLKIMSSYIICN
jgi:hypothetical protein